MTATKRSRALPLISLGLALAAAVLGVARVRFAITEPLWFDEAFTLMVSSRPDWASFWREAWLDINAPGFYLLARGWAAIFGNSDLMLRAPSLLAIWVAGLLPILVPLRGLGREARLTWGALIFAWWGVGFFLDARCYAALLAVSTLQCLCFARLMDRPGVRVAMLWAATASAAILLHYYAVFFGLAQGLIYLGRHRLQAVRTWPAGLVFVPLFAWIAYHAPRLAEYSRLGSAWHSPLDGPRMVGLVQFVFGPTSAFMLAAVALILAVGLLMSRLRPEAPRDEVDGPTSALWLTAASGVLAFALVVGFSLLGSGVSARYLIPVVPPVLLGVVLLAGFGSRARLTYAALVVAYFGVLIPPVRDALAPPRDLPRYEYETGSRMLMDHGVTDLVFAWDHGAAPIMDRTTLERLGGVFFERAGRPVRVRPLLVDAAHDPNRSLVAAARGAHPGLIWMYDRQGHTAARRFPPAIASQTPGWTCNDGAAIVGGYACDRRP